MRWLPFLAVSLLASSAGATYSITAFDTETGELGGAGASCVPYEVDLIHGVVFGRGVFNAQARFDASAKALGLERLEAGDSAAEVLAAVTDPARFSVSASMQWGIVDASGGFATYTGTGAQAYAGDLAGSTADGRFVYTAQGNLLTSRAVLEQARDAFESDGCDLAERLMLALEAAARNGEGDGRCTPEGRPANSAYLDVTRPDGTSVHLSIPDVSPADPTIELRQRYEAFRSERACPIATQGEAESLDHEGEQQGGCSVTVPRRRSPVTAPLLLSILAVFVAALRLRAR